MSRCENRSGLAPMALFGVMVVAGVGTVRAQDNPHDWPMYQRDIRRTGFNPNETKIHRSSAAFLRPKWIFQPGDAITASPVVINFSDFDQGTPGQQPRKVVYVGSADENFYAIHAAGGTEIWRFKADPAPGLGYHMFVASAFVDKPRGRLYVAGGYTMYALDLHDGSLEWKWSTTSGYGGFEIESSPVMINGTVYFGSDGDGRAPGTTNPFPAVFAVDADTGALRWYWRPSEIGTCGDVWCSVAVDLEEGLLYFDTSDCTRAAQGLYNEAIIALPIDPPPTLDPDLRRRDLPNWYYQPRSVDPYDYDFGATPLLFDRNGKKYLGVGGKDGSFYVIERQKAVTPGRFRDVTWKTRVVRGGFSAGFIGSHAYDGERIFGATAIFDLPFATGPTDLSPNPIIQPPFLHAFNPATGDILWQQNLSGPTFAATTGVPGVVFVGSTAHTFSAVDAETGQILWEVPALGAVSSGAAVSDGEVFVGAGTKAGDQGEPVFALHAFHLPPDAPEEPSDELPPKLPPATWPFGVVQYPLIPDGTEPAPTPTPGG